MAFPFSSLIGPAIDFASGIFGGNRDYGHQREILDTNMLFSEKMSSSAYQRSVKDMQAAGLNPMLAYHQGGASTPGGSSPSAAPSGTGEAGRNAVSTALALKRVNAEVDLMKAQQKQVEAKTPGDTAESTRLAYELENLVPTRMQTARLEMDVKETEAYLANLHREYFEGHSAEVRNKQSHGERMRRQEHVRALIYKHFDAKYAQLPAEIRLKMAETALKIVEEKFYPWKALAPAATAAGSLLGGYYLGKGFSAFRHAKTLMGKLGPGMPGKTGGPAVWRSKRERMRGQGGYQSTKPLPGPDDSHF